MANIERIEVTRARLGVGISQFTDKFVDHGNGDDLVPGTNIKRLKPIYLGRKTIGFFSDEIDALIEALRNHRDSVPVPKGDEPKHLQTGRDAYWKRRKRAKERKRETRAESALSAGS